MNFKRYRIVFELPFIALIVYLLHSLFFYFNPNLIENPSLEIIYCFFICCSIVILLILVHIRKKNIDQVGNIFILLTSIKIGLALFVMTFIVDKEMKNIGIGKMNFFIVFAVFLTIETIQTIRILNNKQ